MRIIPGTGKLCLLIAGLLSLRAGILFAREVEITVEDADLGIALEGAVIRSGDGGEYLCDEAGKARIPVPEASQALIRIQYPGYEPGSFVIPAEGDSFTVPLRLGGIMENRELVIEAQRPGTSETRAGRSVGISEQALTRTAETGLVEDVMTSIKLLPGVGYTGFFDAMPSIRGGEPSDLTAVFDGFYIERPYHWGGGVSIFNPKMVESARLSHGVFSVRYGHTISGLLEVSSKKADSGETELEIGISTSAANLSLSYPLGKGGIMVMGRASYWDPFVLIAKQFVKEVGYVRVAPYIRSTAFSSYYRFRSDLEWTAGGFFGSDGVGVSYENETSETNMISLSNMRFNWANKLGFFTSGLTYNPVNTMVIKTSLGVGFLQSDLDGAVSNVVQVAYSPEFLTKWKDDLGGMWFYQILGRNDYFYSVNTIINYQGRIDFDWDLGRGFLFAGGIQELGSQWFQEELYRIHHEEKADMFIGASPVSGYTSYPVELSVDVYNSALNSSAYTLLEYGTENKRFGTELGLRMDHLYFIGRDFTVQTMPVFNPRLNVDLGVLETAHTALDLTFGTGLFSSMNKSVSFIEKQNNIEDFEMKQSRSWTSLGGFSLDLFGALSFNFEGYFKYVFDRAYVSTDIRQGSAQLDYRFDGKGIIWGFDLMLRRFESRYWDGWISYSFTHARYRDPHAIDTENSGPGTNWYYPDFHRFHNFNLVLNVKPLRRFNIATRLGFASGTPKRTAGAITSYPVLLPDGTVIEKWKRDEVYSDTERNPFSIPLDIKFSFYTFNKKGKVQSEAYLSMENLLTLVYSPQGNTYFNSYTGREEEGSDSANYELPIPMISFGFKWSY
jgi:hypothetical protein